MLSQFEFEVGKHLIHPLGTGHKRLSLTTDVDGERLLGGERAKSVRQEFHFGRESALARAPGERAHQNAQDGAGGHGLERGGRGGRWQGKVGDECVRGCRGGKGADHFDAQRLPRGGSRDGPGGDAVELIAGGGAKAIEVNAIAVTHGHVGEGESAGDRPRLRAHLEAGAIRQDHDRCGSLNGKGGLVAGAAHKNPVPGREVKGGSLKGLLPIAKGGAHLHGCVASDEGDVLKGEHPESKHDQERDDEHGRGVPATTGRARVVAGSESGECAPNRNRRPGRRARTKQAVVHRNPLPGGSPQWGCQRSPVNDRAPAFEVPSRLAPREPARTR